MAGNNISIKLNLKSIPGALVDKYGKKDTECIIIPIEYANLFKGEKGVYLDATAIELSKPKEGSKDTHLIKQALPKEVYNALSEDEKKAQPIIGNAIYWGSSTTASTEAKPATEKPDWM